MTSILLHCLIVSGPVRSGLVLSFPGRVACIMAHSCRRKPGLVLQTPRVKQGTTTSQRHKGRRRETSSTVARRYTHMCDMTLRWHGPTERRRERSRKYMSLIAVSCPAAQSVPCPQQHWHDQEHLAISLPSNVTAAHRPIRPHPTLSSHGIASAELSQTYVTWYPSMAPVFPPSQPLPVPCYPLQPGPRQPEPPSSTISRHDAPEEVEARMSRSRMGEASLANWASFVM
jgi:hypothetical protein